MNNWLTFIIQFLLWTCCTSQKECKEPVIDFGEIVKGGKAEYREYDRIQYTCNTGYTMEGSDWIECNQLKWTPTPKCLAPCTITKQQLDHNHLLLSGGHSHSESVKNKNSLEFICKRGYVLITPSIRKCVDGHMDLPRCIPAGDNRSFCHNGNWTNVPACLVVCTAPSTDNGGFHPVQSQYNFGDIIQLYCNQGYELENHSTTSKCTKYGWLPSPTCVSKRCVYPYLEHGALSWSETYYREERFPKKEGQTLSFRCYRGFLPENKKWWYRVTCTKLGWDPEPQCFKKCIPPRRFPHGHIIYTSKNAFIEGDDLSFQCDAGYHPEQQEGKAKCTKDGWLPVPNCALTDVSFSATEHTEAKEVRVTASATSPQRWRVQVVAASRTALHPREMTSIGQYSQHLED